MTRRRADSVWLIACTGTIRMIKMGSSKARATEDPSRTVSRTSQGARNAAGSRFHHPGRKGATGIDVDTEAIGACRVPGDSLNLRDNATANQELALAA